MLDRVFEPPRARFLQCVSRLHRLRIVPSLRRVDHHRDLGTGSISRVPHTFRLLGRWRSVAEAKLHTSITGIGVFPYRPLRIIDGDAVTHTIAGIGDDLISINAKQPKNRLAKRFPQRVPDRNVDRRQRLI